MPQKAEVTHPANSQNVWAILTMKKLLILFVGLASICTDKATVVADAIIEGLPIKVISSGKSYKVFEQYPWEGHSSKYGPKGESPKTRSWRWSGQKY